MNTITIYAASWCKKSQEIINKLHAADVAVAIKNIDDKEHGQNYTTELMEINTGKRIIPTLVVENKKYPHPTTKQINEIIKNENKADDTVARCSLGKELCDGDAVILTRDLDVKGSSINLKQGTIIEKIKTTNNPDYVDCRIGKSTLSIKTIFTRKR